MKKYKKKCPICDKYQYYSLQKTLDIAIKNNTNCLSCVAKNRIHTEERSKKQAESIKNYYKTNTHPCAGTKRSQESIEKQVESVKKYYDTHSAWNKGLTKETSDIIARGCVNREETNKQKKYKCELCGEIKSGQTFMINVCMRCYSKTRVRTSKYPDIFERNCPKCNNIIRYKKKRDRYFAEEKNSLCKSCGLKGKTYQEIYGDRYDDITGRRSESLKKVKHTWHNKIAESRRNNGTNRLSVKHKQWIRDNGHFSNTGENHVRIKKILKDRNITYEQYCEEVGKYHVYKREVTYWTSKQDVSTLDNYEKRGKAGISGSYNLDHIIEISEGYINNISPEVIGNINNLQFITF